MEEWPEHTASFNKRRGMLACCFAPRVEDEQMAAAAAARQASIVTQADVKPVSRTATQLSSVCTKDSLLLDVPAATVAMGQEKPGILAVRRSIDQGMLLQDLPNLQPLMALFLQRPYTDADWFAAMTALEKVQRLQQQRALQQLRATHRISHASFASGQSGVDDDTGEHWYDAQSHSLSDSGAVSEADWDEVVRLADTLEQFEHQQGQLTVPICRELAAELPACVPNPPLLAADPNWKYCCVDVRPFCSYWERDNVCSTPFPLPIDDTLRLGPLQKKTHESVPGMWLREEGHQLLLTAQPSMLLIPGLVAYHEYYNKDSSPSSWMLRRDIKIGKTTGQMFMTTDGILIFRVFTYGMFSKQVEWIGEDYIRLEDNGETIVTRQVLSVPSDGQSVTQFLIGRRRGPSPPRTSLPTPSQQQDQQ